MHSLLEPVGNGLLVCCIRNIPFPSDSKALRVIFSSQLEGKETSRAAVPDGDLGSRENRLATCARSCRE